MTNSTETTVPVAKATAKGTSAWQPFHDLLANGAQAWNLSNWMTLGVLIAPLFVAASGIVAAFAGKEIYKLYTEEDGVAEVLQVLLYASSSIMCLFVARHQFRARQPLIAALYVLLACGLFFLVGEEMSWGQRVFGWETPVSLEAINKQEETNLHNIHGVGKTFKWIQMLVGAYGAILPLLLLRTRVPERFRTLVDSVLPHFTLILYFLPMFGWRLYRNLAGDPVSHYYLITNYNEVIELILAMGFCLFMVFQLRKCRRAYSPYKLA
jgi:hypothetical protein